MPEPSESTGEAFGLSGMPDTAPPEEGNPFVDVEDEPSPEPRPTEEPPAEPPAEGEPQPARSAEEGEAPEPSETEKLLAGRYKDVPSLEQGYKEIQGAYTRERQERLADAQRLARAESVLAQLAQQFQRDAQVRQLAQAQEDPEAAQRLEVQGQVDQRLQAFQQQQAQQQQAQVAQQAVVASILGFRQKHPDIVADSPEDYAVADIVDKLQLDTADPEMLEVAYEAFKDESLREVLEAQPDLVVTEQGMQYARRQAQLLAQVGGPAANGAPGSQPSQGTAPKQRPPHVESGGGGTPPTGPAEEKDEFDQVLDLYEKSRTGNVFGL